MSSFGEELRRERELREITLREIAEATKINLRHLEALERNDFAHLPGGVFNRGFVRAYCQHIGVDAEAMVNAYILEERAQSGEETPAEPGLLRRPAGGPPVGRPAGPRAAELGDRPGAWHLWVGALLIAGALLACVYLYIRFTQDGEQRSGPDPVAAESHPGATRE